MALLAALTVLTLIATFFHNIPARAEVGSEPVDRAFAVSAWRYGGAQVRAAAEAALLGTDDQVRQFLDTTWQQAQKADERDMLADVIAGSGPSTRAAAQQALNAADAGDVNAISTFLSTGWQGPANIDTRVSVNELMAISGPQVAAAAQAVLDTDDPAAMKAFLDSGWQLKWKTDERLRVNQAMASGGPQVRAAAQQALDADTPEALEGFLAYGWEVASARDDEVATLTDLLAQAQAAGDLAAQETETAKQEGARAKDAAEAAKKAAADAAAATQAAQQHTEEAAAHAKQAAAAADKAVKAAQTAVDAAAAASRAARAAASAAARAAHAAAKAGQAATAAYQAAADAATHASGAAAARQAAENARNMAQQARSFIDAANQAGVALQAGLESVQSAKSAAASALAAAASNDDAVRWAQQAGADASAAVAAAQRARANAERAVRAAQAAEDYLNTAMAEAFAARDAAFAAANDADAAAAAAEDAANHAGEAAQAANRATAAANSATAAAQRALDAAAQAGIVYQAARDADAARLAVVRDQGIESAQAANVQFEAQRQKAHWDVAAAAKRTAETNQLIALAQNPATDPAVAVPAARKVALALADSQGPWTQQAALDALTGDDPQVLAFVRTGLAQANAQDDRIAVTNIAVTDNTALRTAAETALNGSDATVKSFLQNQNYAGRYSQDRLKINQIKSAATTAGDTVLANAAQTALDADTLPAFRDFLGTGQYNAAAIGQRVLVNQAAAAGSAEVQASAQIALDGPPSGLKEFLTTGQYYASGRDYEQAAHLSVVAGLLKKINEVAETARQNALQAQSIAAQARNDATSAADYANQAAASAQLAATYAAQAQAYAADAGQSVQRAAAAVTTAKNAATKADASARSAVKSAAWAVASQQLAINAAQEAHASAERAYASATAAGQDAAAAVAAAEAAYKAAEAERASQLYACGFQYAEGPNADLEKLLGAGGESLKACTGNVLGDPQELATRAYVNATYCDTYYQRGTQYYQDCIMSTLDPDFRAVQPLLFTVQVITAAGIMYAVPVGMVSGVLCIATVACGAALGTLFTIADVGVNLFKLINGDQSLGQTLLNLGQTALESLALAGIGKALSAGFRGLKALYTGLRDIKMAQGSIQLAKFSQLQFDVLSWIRSCTRTGNSFAPGTPVRMADGRTEPIEDVKVGDLVLAADTKKGVTEPQVVTQTITGRGDKQLVDLTVGAGRVTATANHPFWAPDLRQWVAAGHLRAGQWLQTSAGTWAQIGAVAQRSGPATVHNLTVARDHTFYVAAGANDLLVHNMSCRNWVDIGNGWFQSEAGLMYGPESKEGHRVLHVISHMFPDSTGTSHTVFIGTQEEVFALIDEGYLAKDGSMILDQVGNRITYRIPMGRTIGTRGETHLCLSLEIPDVLITAFPTTPTGTCRG